jgi:hypothetical membrane protein
MSKRLWIPAGLLAPICYAAAVILGGALMPGYSHLRDAISSLTETGAPVIPAVNALFIAYNWLILIFAAGLWLQMRRQGHRLAAAGALALVAVGLSGVLMFWFTQDPIGAPLTWHGIGHFVLAAVEALGTIAACLLCGLGFRQVSGLNSLRTYSVVSALVIFISGGANTATISFNPYFGLVERVTIFTYIVWTFVVALRLTARRAAV